MKKIDPKSITAGTLCKIMLDVDSDGTLFMFIERKQSGEWMIMVWENVGSHFCSRRRKLPRTSWWWTDMEVLQ